MFTAGAPVTGGAALQCLLLNCRPCVAQCPNPMLIQFRSPPMLAGQPALAPAPDLNNLALMKRPVASLFLDPTPMKRSRAHADRTCTAPARTGRRRCQSCHPHRPGSHRQLSSLGLPIRTRFAEYLPTPALMIRVDRCCYAPQSPGCYVMEDLNVEVPMKGKDGSANSAKNPITDS